MLTLLRLQFTSVEFSELVKSFFARDTIDKVACKLRLNRKTVASYFRNIQLAIAQDHILRGYGLLEPKWKFNELLISNWIKDITTELGKTVYPVLAFARPVKAILIKSLLDSNNFECTKDVPTEAPVGIVVTTTSPESKAHRQRQFLFRSRPMIINGIEQANAIRLMKGIKRMRRQPKDDLPAYWKSLSMYLKSFRGIPKEHFQDHLTEFEWKTMVEYEWKTMIDFYAGDVPWKTLDEFREYRLHGVLSRSNPVCHRNQQDS